MCVSLSLCVYVVLLHISHTQISSNSRTLCYPSSAQAVSDSQHSTCCKLVLRNVRRVPEIRLKLLSAGVLDDEGFNSLLGERKWKLLKGRMVVARAEKIFVCDAS